MLAHRFTILAPLQRIFEPILTTRDLKDGWVMRWTLFSDFPRIGWISYEHVIVRRMNEPWPHPPMLGFSPGAFLLESTDSTDVLPVFPLHIGAQLVDEPGTISWQ